MSETLNKKDGEGAEVIVGQKKFQIFKECKYE